MATAHYKENEESFGTLNEGYFHIIKCSCGEVIEAGPRQSSQAAMTAASTLWSLHLQG